jgi:6-phosphogluconolactonase
MVLFCDYISRQVQADSLAALVAGQLAGAIDRKGRASLAVPGGSTPAAFLRKLSQADISWQHVSIMLTDERWVPESSARSNTKLLRENLLQSAASKATLVPLFKPSERPEDVIDDLEAGIRAALPLDVCVVGMGTDMHTASLFPGALGLTDAMTMDCPRLLIPVHPQDREALVTLTAPALCNAENLHILFNGPEKLVAYQVAEQSGPVSDAPIRVILRAVTPVTVHYAQ